MSSEDELVQIRTRPHISYSEWMKFRNTCQHRWYLDTIVKPEVARQDRQDRSIHTDFGKAVHSTIERMFNPDLDQRIDLETAKQFFSESFMQSVEELTDLGLIEYGPVHEKVSAQHPADLVVAGERILDGLASCPELRDGTIVKFEHRLFVPLSRTDSPIHFKGFIDLIFTVKDKRGKTVMLLCDFKTCTWGWPAQKKSDLDVCAQPILYKHFLSKETGVDPKLVRVYFILLKKTPRPNDTPVEFVRVNSSESATRSVINSLQTDITRIRNGPPYEKNRDSCLKWGGCRYYDTEYCPGKVEKKARKK